MTSKDVTRSNEGTVAAGLAKAFVEFAAANGVDRGLLLIRAGLETGALENPEARIPLSAYVSLIDTGIALTRDPALALKFGYTVRAETISIVALISLASETLGDSFVQIARYARLMVHAGERSDTPFGRIEVNQDGQWLVAEDRAYLDHFHVWEILFAQMCSGFRRMLGATPPGVIVHCPHPAPSYRAEYGRIYDGPVVFGCEWSAIRMPQEVLEMRMPQFNSYAFGLLSERADALLKELENTSTTRGEVERHLSAMFHTGAVGIERVARKMNVSQKTLYRRLKAEDVTFEQVLDSLRHRLALSFLADKKVSVNETAYLVGFSDAAAFSRAFKRWTGTSPGAVATRKGK